MLSDKQQNSFRKRLEEEKTLLERELSSLGKRNPANPSDWETGKPEGDEFGPDRNDNADIMEDMEEDAATVGELEGRLLLVNAALEKTDTGAYGLCEVCGEDIEEDRLNANPAAPTCKVHMV